mmetsp:Transcript_48008/g.79519  ORF Transcript_48008/g.79519 Transcript_48008/m.79519 type:complete len:200 (-) Transcript_48008:65-664(-)
MLARAGLMSHPRIMHDGVSTTLVRPKRARNAFNFFQLYAHTRIQSRRVEKNSATRHTQRISRIIRDVWEKMSESEKEVFQHLATKDQSRYNAEQKRYLEGMKNFLTSNNKQIKAARRCRKKRAAPEPAVTFKLDFDPFSEERLSHFGGNELSAMFHHNIANAKVSKQSQKSANSYSSLTQKKRQEEEDRARNCARPYIT